MLSVLSVGITKPFVSLASRQACIDRDNEGDVPSIDSLHKRIITIPLGNPHTLASSKISHCLPHLQRDIDHSTWMVELLSPLSQSGIQHLAHCTPKDLPHAMSEKGAYPKIDKRAPRSPFLSPSLLRKALTRISDGVSHIHPVDAISGVRIDGEATAGDS